ncbi:MAG: cysteine dioxygenase family protein [Pseudomonadota bacterium]
MSASLQTVSASLPPHCRALTPAPLVSEIRFVQYIETVDALLAGGHDSIAKQVADALRTLIREPDWLPDDCCLTSDECYRRHLLYADPLGRYTVMSVAWLPGQASPVHGHSAWCAMGVYAGHPTAEGFSYTEGAEPVRTNVHHCKPGDVDGINPGCERPHRVFNGSDETVLTIHTYGRDLVDEPCSINILFD